MEQNLGGVGPGERYRVQRPCDVEAGSRATCPGFAVNTRGVERDSVMHVSIQFWHEPWPYGMDNEKTEIR